MIEFLVKRKDLDSKYFVVGNQQAIDKIQTCLIEYSKCISHGFDIINFYIKNKAMNGPRYFFTCGFINAEQYIYNFGDNLRCCKATCIY